MDSVAYLGIPGSFTHTAAKRCFKSDELIGKKNFSEIFEAVADGEVNYGVIPIENTLAGSIYENYDLLDKHNLVITGETYVKIEHCLLVPKDSPAAKTGDVDKIKRVYSHPKALEQCSVFLGQYPNIERMAYGDSATAARYVSGAGDDEIAAISASVNAETYGLKVLKSNIQDDGINYTRFLVISREPKPTDSRKYKCSLDIRLKHATGSLSSVFSYLSENGCNVMKIESRPIHDHPFEYTFYIDFAYDNKNNDMDDVIKNIGPLVQQIKVLGVYADGRAQIK